MQRDNIYASKSVIGVIYFREYIYINNTNESFSKIKKDHLKSHLWFKYLKRIYIYINSIKKKFFTK